jgi:hypothetical protein
VEKKANTIIPASTVEEHEANADEIDRRWSDVLQDWQKVIFARREIDYTTA